MSVLDARGRGAPATLTPSSAVPLAWFGLAHLSLAGGLAVLAASPGLPGAFFYHPKMIAVVHLLTLGWITGSILGSLYIVAPLALGVPMRAGWRDWTAFAFFAIGLTGMVAHFWIATYDGMAWSAAMVLAAVAYVGWKVLRGLPGSPAAPAVRLHVRLAFFNIMAAGALGILIGIDRSRGFLGLSPVAATYAHAHVATLGWAVMMAVGLSYRLIPMMLPSAMPKGRMVAASAVLIEAGLILIVGSLFVDGPIVPAAGVLIVAGLVSFAVQLTRTALCRLPRPPARPRRDWSIWQVHAAFLWLLIAVTLGWTLSREGVAGSTRMAWVYGTAGLLGYVAQMIAGMHGRLVPYYAWYRAMAALGDRPRTSAHALPSPFAAGLVFFAWTAGVPGLAAGLALEHLLLIRAGALALLTGVAAGGVHMMWMLRLARRTRKEEAVHAAGRRSPLAAGTHHAH